MNLQEIKEAVDNGKTVKVGNDAYEVVKSNQNYLIKCLVNNSCIGLTWADGKTLNAKQENFYIKQK